MEQIQSLQRLIADRPSYEPTSDALFGAVYGVRTVILNTAAYETLKVVGLQLVSNSEIRAGIAIVFDHYYERLGLEHGFEAKTNLALLRPHYLQHFENLRFWETATPLDNQAVISDPYFRNRVDYRLILLRSNQMDSDPRAIGAIRKVIGLLDQEWTD